jgi:ABC-2 type transport system permease protein
MYNLFTKTLYDKRAFIIGWCFGLAALGALMMLFYPAFHEDTGLDQLIKNLPPAFQGLVGNLADLKTLPSYIGSQLFAVRVPIFVSILSIILSLGLSIAEEERGQLRSLAMLPLSRLHILRSKWFAAVVICLIVTCATFVGIEIGMASIGETIDPWVLVRLGVMTWLLAVCLTTIVTSIGLATGRRGVTMGVGVLIAAGSFILTTFTQSVDWLHPYEKISLLHYFPATDISKGSIDLTDVAVYLSLIVIFLIIGSIGFRRRDIR